MIPPIRTLSLWQPWASLMALGLKRMETRSWPMRHRGPLAIATTQTIPSWLRAEIAVRESCLPPEAR